MSWVGRVLGREQPAEKRYLPPSLSVMANVPLGQVANSGVNVTPDTSMRLTAVYACIHVISEDIASLPLRLYRRLRPEGEEEARNHPLFKVLHEQPNPEQTSMEWRGGAPSPPLLSGKAYL